MASDGQYLYIAYRTNEEEGGLYRTDLSLEHTQLLCHGHFSGLYLVDGTLYYTEGRGYGIDETTYHYMNTIDLYPMESNKEEYQSKRLELDTSDGFELPSYRHHCAVMGDVAYFVEGLGEVEEDSDEYSVPLLRYALSTVDWEGAIKQTDVTWEHRGTLDGGIRAYGDYLFYSRPLGAEEAETDADADQEASAKDDCFPCCYDTKSGTEMVLTRKRSLNTDVYAVNVTSGYLLVSSYDDDVCDGPSLYLEKLSDPNSSVWVKDLVKGAETVDADQREEAKKREEEEALRNEPYGPGTATLHLKAPSDKSAAYRLVRMDGSTEFLVRLDPGEEKSQSFPEGRYTLKVAEGKEWISDEEAFGSGGHYSTTDVYVFEDGGDYSIGGGVQGDFSKDDASGFVN